MMNKEEIKKRIAEEEIFQAISAFADDGLSLRGANEAKRNERRSNPNVSAILMGLLRFTRNDNEFNILQYAARKIL
ncbi:MAG: hypothetical protein V1688_02970 [bacterium]